MPELPDIRLYLHALESRIVGRALERVAIPSPFVLRSVNPSAAEFQGRGIERVERIGKRIVIACAGEYFLVIHLMVAGRLRWIPAGGSRGRGPKSLTVITLQHGSLHLTEAGTKHRASLHLVRGREALAPFHRGGLDLEEATLEQFRAALTRENHTLKRALTDPTIIDGVGNAYSDEILHHARLSPLALTAGLPLEALARLHSAGKFVLGEWSARLVAETGDAWPEKVTAFRPGMAAHGRYQQPCPACRTPIQRIRYAENETNYCPTCQTGGRLLADRALSRLLREDWPRSLAAMEERIGRGTGLPE